MEIIVNDPTCEPHPDSPFDDYEQNDFESFLKDLVNEVKALSEEIELIRTDIGRGASWPTVLVIIGGIFFLGKQINENLEAWRSIVNKVCALFERIHKRFGRYRVDVHGASYIAAQAILLLEKHVATLEKNSEQVIPVYPLTYLESDHLDGYPDSFYLTTYIVNKEIRYIVLIKSNGKIIYIHKIDTMDWTIF